MVEVDAVKRDGAGQTNQVLCCNIGSILEYHTCPSEQGENVKYFCCVFIRGKDILIESSEYYGAVVELGQPLGIIVNTISRLSLFDDNFSQPMTRVSERFQILKPRFP
jgi:hypothetical protein